jgi:hypothetical protein
VLASTRSVAYPREVQYLEFLARVHELLTGPPYLEIGIRHGDSLALARGRAAGVDPEFELRVDLPDSVELFAETSDEYFDRKDPLAPLGGRRVGYSFIDGMHLAEFALRDFMGVERISPWTGVIVFDDILPRTIEEANRDRRTRAWTGDVYKVLGILARHRPDLICLRVGTQPTGLLLVLGLDPSNRTLSMRQDALLEQMVVPDPQDVPAEIIERRGVLDPEAVLASRAWPVLRDLRDQDSSRRAGIRDLRRAVHKDLGRVSPSALRRLLPA